MDLYGDYIWKSANFYSPLNLIKLEKYNLTDDDANTIIKLCRLKIDDDLIGYLGKKSERTKIGEILGGLNQGTVYNYLLLPNTQKSIDKEAFSLFCDAIDKFIEPKKIQNLPAKEIALIRKYPQWKAKVIQKNENRLAVEKKSKLIKVKKPRPVFKDRRFIESKWYCYERRDFGGKVEIAKSLIEFGRFNNKGIIDIKLQFAERRIADWIGHGFFNDKDGILSINLNTGNGNDYTHFLFRIDTRDKDISLCIGHKTFSTEEHSNIVSKTILIERITDKGLFKPSLGLFSFRSPSIPGEICRFLSVREKNRMSSPHSFVISNLNLLDAWLKENEVRPSVRISSLVGKYSVYYTVKEILDFKIDRLEICKSDRARIIAKYIHMLDDGEKEEHEGEVLINYTTGIMTLILHGPQVQEEDGKINIYDNRPIVLIITIPSQETQVIEVLTGIIAGTRDYNDGIVARLTVLVKEGKAKKVSIQNEELLKKYFAFFAPRGKVRPPSKRIISKFRDVEAAMQKKLNARQTSN